MTNIEKIKHIRGITLFPMNKINEALTKANGDVNATLKILLGQMSKDDIVGMENRVAAAKIVYSYVHNHRISATVVLACQTDFVARNETFLNLAKDICIHIVSTPIRPEFVSKDSIPEDIRLKWAAEYTDETEGKPAAIRDKIIQGKIQKRVNELCLLNQSFIKDDTITVGQLIASVSAQTGEKIEVKKFVKITANDA